MSTEQHCNHDPAALRLIGAVQCECGTVKLGGVEYVATGGVPTPVLQLYGLLKANEDGDGSWSGGDVVNILGEWFDRFGITQPSEADDPHPCPACQLVFTDADEDDDDDANARLGLHILESHTPIGDQS